MTSYNNYGETVAGFDSRLKYYDFLHSLMKESIYFLRIGDFEHSLQNICFWKGLLPFKSKDDFIIKNECDVCIKKAENELSRISRNNNLFQNNKIDKFEKHIICLHSLLNNFMHIKNMHIPTKIVSDPGTTVATVQYD